MRHFYGLSHLPRESMAIHAIIGISSAPRRTDNELTLVTTDDFSELGLLYLVGGLTHHWKHPLSTAIKRIAQNRGLSLPGPPSFSSVTGEGIVALIDARVVCLGPMPLFERFNIDLGPLIAVGQSLKAKGHTIIYAGVDSRPAGLIGMRS